MGKTKFMKNIRLLLLALFVHCVTISVHGAVDAEVIKVTYDENFTPQYVIKVVNTEPKVLTNIIVTFIFSTPGAFRDDIFAREYIEKNIKVDLRPNYSVEVPVSITPPHGKDLLGTRWKKARFSDGSIKSN